MRKTQLLLRVFAVVSALMSVTGCFRYTSIGIDSDTAEGNRLRHRYYRVQWPGDGTFHLSSGAIHYPCHPNACRSEPFDLAGRFFLPPKREPPRTLWNRLGFWYYNSSRPPIFTVGVPAVIPAGLFLWFAFAPKMRYSKGAKFTEKAEPPC